MKSICINAYNHATDEWQDYTVWDDTLEECREKADKLAHELAPEPAASNWEETWTD